MDEQGRAIYDPDLPSYDPKGRKETADLRIPLLDENGKQKTRVRKGKGTEYLWCKLSIPSNDWNDKSNAEVWRESWAVHCNKYLDAAHRIGKKNLKGCILHSDRGSTYASNEYVARMNEYGIIGSMSRTGNCWDNAHIESFWGRMKVEWIEGQYETREEAIQDIYEFIWGYYNTSRLHSTNGYRTPSEAYKESPVA